MRLSLLAAAATAVAATASRGYAPYDLVTLLSLDPFESTLVTAVQAAGLVATLQGKGPFTIFAPDDRAFEALPAGVLPALLKNKTLLTEVLTYHVVAGNVSSSQLTNGEQVKTVNGADISVEIFTDPRINQTFVQLNHDSFVTYANNFGTNGVFHTIDRVLIPRAGISDGLRELLEGGRRAAKPASKAALRAKAAPALNIVQRLSLIPEMSTLVAAVKAANLVNALSTTTATLFAPDDRAFERLPPGVLPALLKNVTALTDILLYHAHAGAVLSKQLYNGEQVSTLLKGATIGVEIFNATQPVPQSFVVLDHHANVIIPDVTATNGVIHIIDEVLIPRA